MKERAPTTSGSGFGCTGANPIMAANPSELYTLDIAQIDPFSTGGMVSNLSYVLLIASMAMRNIFWLRILAICSGLTGIAFDVFWTGNISGIFWETCFTVVNLAQWIVLLVEKKRAYLSRDQVALRDRVFPTLSNTHMLKLLALAKPHAFIVDRVLTENGRDISTLYLVERGEASVVVDETPVSKCQAGDFIGEIGFLTGVPACATVSAASDLECLAFDCAELRALMRANPDLDRGLNVALTANLATKLIRNNETLLCV